MRERAKRAKHNGKKQSEQILYRRRVYRVENVLEENVPRWKRPRRAIKCTSLLIIHALNITRGQCTTSILNINLLHSYNILVHLKYCSFLKFVFQMKNYINTAKLRRLNHNFSTNFTQIFSQISFNKLHKWKVSKV